MTAAGTVTHRGRWYPEDRAAEPYRYLPVEVPSWAAGLRVELSYDRSEGVLDLGCFAPGDEFRGWSGGARSRYAIGSDWATPGYLAGPLPAGEWRVALGLHRVPAGGIAWEVHAEVGAANAEPSAPAPPVPQRPRRRVDLPAPDGLRWLAGDLHAHTLHSDGALTVDQLAALAAATGLDFLAVTDHNTTSHHPALAAAGARYGLTLLPGQEVTTGMGHANAFGAIGWVDFRRPAADWVSTVDARGGLLSVNHPLGGDCAWRQPLPYRPPLAEVWHSGWWDRTWGAPLAWLLGWDPAAVPVGGSDFHDPDHTEVLGRPTTWVAAADASVPAILDALRAGRVAISESPAGPLLLRVGGELIALGADGLLLTGFHGRRRIVRGERYALPAEDGVHWLEDGTTRVMALAG
jgi:hypothetical protein